MVKRWSGYLTLVRDSPTRLGTGAQHTSTTLGTELYTVSDSLEAGCGVIHKDWTELYSDPVSGMYPLICILGLEIQYTIHNIQIQHARGGTASCERRNNSWPIVTNTDK